MSMNGQNMGQYIVPFVCLLIVIMDLTAGILGIQAEVAQNKVQNLRVWIFECRDPSYQAFKLGFAAAVLLAFAHAIANLFGGCHCVWSKPELDRATSNKQLAMASLILSWYEYSCIEISKNVLNTSAYRSACISVAVLQTPFSNGAYWVCGVSMKTTALPFMVEVRITLVIGFSMLIAGVMANSSSRKSCGVSNHRYLSIGGIACIIHGMFAVSYYISATAVEKEEKKLNPPGP
ncbi:hypothetical protein OSB04_001948 [Centaurea solstitialis]|uniref:Uncharacterized protein n=1 Tax=Centaurea solstitialis TaxID=347529 RepID=A0AA38WLW3_9ASTR|nr:hypothetical protein OSB04_001948 [Centaurea solstitialis]